MLMLDQRVQISEYDERLYHAALVGPALRLLKEGSIVILLGGGDGCALRDVLKSEKVRKVCLVEIDEEVISVAKRYLNDLNENSFDDERVEVVIDDAVEYIREFDGKVDFVASDVTEYVKEISYEAFKREFFEDVKRILEPEGLFSTHVDAVGKHMMARLSEIAADLKEIFPNVCFYKAFIPSYFCEWAFATASVDIDASKIEEAVGFIPGLQLLSEEELRP